MSHRPSRHITRGFVLVLLAGVGYQQARHHLVPETFGDVGHYRAAALGEIAGQAPRFQGRDMCYECHDDIVDLVVKDTHHSVNCEDCHGPGNLHVAYMMGEEDEGITEEMAALPKIKDRSLCLYCHRRLSARPMSFPQIDPPEHVSLLLREGEVVDCVECHSPHEPIFLTTAFSEARLHPIIQECFHCHDPVPDTPIEEVEDHTPVFSCDYCHEGLTEDFAKRSHSNLSCGTCHHFTRVSETAGRIFKNGNPRFCLLCHEDRSFKDEEAIPLVRWPEHLDEEEIPPEERDQTCVECHWEQIHAMDEGVSISGEDR